eukprot:1145494-Pelagomonas_calceolata.AAC.3
MHREWAARALGWGAACWGLWTGVQTVAWMSLVTTALETRTMARLQVGRQQAVVWLCLPSRAALLKQKRDHKEGTAAATAATEATAAAAAAWPQLGAQDGQAAGAEGGQGEAVCAAECAVLRVSECGWVGGGSPDEGPQLTCEHRVACHTGPASAPAAAGDGAGAAQALPEGA